MGRTKLDNRIRILVENGVATGHRSMFAIVGDKARDQVPVLHHILAHASVASRPSVLWCYKKELGFSSHRKKRMKEIKNKLAVSKINVREEDHFDVFIASTQIRFCYYSETQNILGNTFGMLILQDFEALTPNLLARTMETVEGGGLVVFLLKSVNSLRQLFTLSMDVHNRYRTDANSTIVARFNERFVLSLGSCSACVFMDDQLNVLPISSHIINLTKTTHTKKSPSEEALETVKDTMRDTPVMGNLVGMCRTECQANALLRLMDLITEKKNATCSLTAARGRGKSAVLGLALAGAIAFGYTNIFVTSPSPENLKTLFEFVLKGFDALDYVDHVDYELVRSSEAAMNKCVVRVNVTRTHRQWIQYVSPCDATRTANAELLFIDEAAAIPLPLVQRLITGPFICVLSSTINGYEGTGRSLSLKLFEQLKKAKALHEITLTESIRYRPADPIEKLLNQLLCLDFAPRRLKGTPPPSECSLYYVNRDTLFSCHPSAEFFLQQIVSISVASHYKNQPNDVQLLADAPGHHVFVLTAPIAEDDDSLPQVLVVVQLSIEGGMLDGHVEDSLSKGKRASGDLLPWVVSQQFLDSDFARLLGGRVVRIAVHPDYQSMGYGTRAMEELEAYFEGQFPCVYEEPHVESKSIRGVERLALLEEQISPRDDLPPLLMRLTERRAEQLQYLGVSFGVTVGLLKFWKKCGYTPVYLRQQKSDLTGEHTSIMLKRIGKQLDGEWLPLYWTEFRGRLFRLLGCDMSDMTCQLALSLAQSPLLRTKRVLTRDELAYFVSNRDMKRLAQFARNMADPQLVTDLVPVLASLFFNDHLEVTLPAVQAAVLLALGLQHKTIDAISHELHLPPNQVFAFHAKTIRKLSAYLDRVCMDSVAKELETETPSKEIPAPLKMTLEEDLTEAAKEISQRQERDKKKMAKQLEKNLSQYAIQGTEEEWKAAMEGGIKQRNIVSVSNKRKKQLDIPVEKEHKAKKIRKSKGGRDQ